MSTADSRILVVLTIFIVTFAVVFGGVMVQSHTIRISIEDFRAEQVDHYRSHNSFLPESVDLSPYDPLLAAVKRYEVRNGEWAITYSRLFRRDITFGPLRERD